MKIETRDFGIIEMEEEDIITFRQPVYGFEHLTRYVMLSEEEMSNGFVWLQSLEEVDICFILVDPQVLDTDYHPLIPRSVAELLGEGDEICWCIATIPENFEKATANLKSPIMINPHQKCAAQVILDEPYPIRQPIVSGGKE